MCSSREGSFLTGFKELATKQVKHYERMAEVAIMKSEVSNEVALMIVLTSISNNFTDKKILRSFSKEELIDIIVSDTLKAKEVIEKVGMK